VSWRRMERNPRAKVLAFALVDRDLQHDGQLVLDRVLGREGLAARLMRLRDLCVQGRGLARVGPPPVTSSPCACAILCAIVGGSRG